MQTRESPEKEYDVNNPPSVPPSPMMLGDDRERTMLADVLADGFTLGTSVHRHNRGDSVIDVDDDTTPEGLDSHGRSLEDQLRRSRSIVPEDVCFPIDDAVSEMAYDDMPNTDAQSQSKRRRRADKIHSPDLSYLEQWSREEKEQRISEGNRAKKISEPVLVGGRLRPNPRANQWHRQEEDVPYRFTYFNEEFPSTIHSQSISELVQPGSSFRELFIPEPTILSSDDSDTESDEDLISFRNTSPLHMRADQRGEGSRAGDSIRSSKSHTRASSIQAGTPSGRDPLPQKKKPAKKPQFGPRPTFWLDVMSPTEAEMKILAKAFKIHPLTAEDIMMQEAREKVELFRNYYFVNYRTFEQDTNSEDFLEPVNMYVVVLQNGVLSFHFSMTPHPANVRRRIRQLKDYLIPSADWISYAIIDDITDVFAPLIQVIEDEVDEIDDMILKLHTSSDSINKSGNKDPSNEKKGQSEAGETVVESGGDMLRRVGDARKKVMGLYRLLGNKADVIKGFAKRCNEQWEIAPRSDIGLYLGDIQDHIVTMTANLSHYEKCVLSSLRTYIELEDRKGLCANDNRLLSRSHSNYLAQINIRMNERSEKTADVLGKLTVLGTIVLPMNIVTGLWGMNVLVPGQDIDNLYWFFAITVGLIAFGFGCFFIAKRVYRIV
jgi:magnesium transporter